MDSDMVADVQKLMRKLRSEANYQRWNNNSAAADLMEEVAMSLDNIMNKYDIHTQLRPGDSRGQGWRLNRWFGFQLVHLR